jgi:RHS repeat-associated protein
VYYYHFDGLGSVVALSDVNSVLVERYTYDVFGRPTIRDPNGAEIAESAFANPYLFTGRAYDAETGLFYYRARYYDFATGRFLQPDPTGYTDGLNLYSYCGNNPFNFLDPSGLCKESLFGRVMNVVGAVSVPVVLTCAAILCPPVGVGMLMLSGFMGGLYVGEGVITGTDIYGNPLSTSERVYRTAIGGVMIGTSLYAAGQMQAALEAPAARSITTPYGVETQSMTAEAQAAPRLDRNQLTKAGRALQKHASRPGSVYETTATRASDLNAAGQDVVDDILTTPGSRIVPNPKGGIDVIAPNGQAIRYDAGGNFKVECRVDG